MEKIKVEEWLKDNLSGSGDGHGSGSGSGSGSGDGHGSGSGCGSGFGSGSGDGHGSGCGSGFGFGSGCGNGISCFEKKHVFIVDGIQTIITHIKGAIATGFILNNDFTKTPCFIAKGQGYFAHGKNIQEAVESLRAKIFENMDSEEAIAEFVKKFKKGERYKGTEFFEWHHYLTGSCLMGRESFVRNKGLNVEDMFTVEEFIEICENNFGSEIIKQLKEKWNELEE